MAAEGQTVNIHIKTLKGQKMGLEINLSHSVAELKQQIESELKLGEASTMRLVYCGKILKKDQKLSSFGFKDGEFIVLTKVKKRVAKRPASQPTQPQQPAATSEPAPAQPTGSNNNAASAAAPEAPSSGTGNAEVNAELESTLQNLMAMGFTREQCQQALRAAYNNAERAVEYLLNGLPANFNPADVMPSQPNVGRPAAMGGQQRQPAAGQGQGQNQPSQQRLQQLLQGDGLARSLILRMISNPRLRQLFFQAVQTVRPDFQMSRESNEAMENILGLLQDPRVLQMCLHLLIGGEGPEAAMPPSASGGPGAPVQVQVTAEELEQIKRLSSTLGVTQQRAVEAFLLADRNLEVAASFLMSSNEDGAFGAAAERPPVTENNEMQVEVPGSEDAPEQMQIEENQNEEESGDNSGQNNENEPKPEN